MNKSRKQEMGNVDQGLEHKVTRSNSRKTQQRDREREGSVYGCAGAAEGGEEDGASAVVHGSSSGWWHAEEEDEATLVTRATCLDGLCQWRMATKAWCRL